MNPQRNFGNGISYGLGVFSLGVLLVAVACGTATPTPTRVASTPTSVLVAQATATRSGAAVTPTIAPTPTLTSTVVLTEPTKVAQFVNPTNTPRPPSPTPVGPPPPGPLTGRMAYSVRLPGVDFVSWQIWIMNADGTGAHRILERSRWPALSPDGSRIAYYERDAGMYIANADGRGGKLVIDHSGACCFTWSPDGQWIAYTESVLHKLSRSVPAGPIKKLRVTTAFNPTQTILDLGNQVRGTEPAFSPDGRQIAYGGCLINTSTCGVMVVSADGGTPRMITTDVGGVPRWSPSGSQIVYHAGVGGGRVQVFVVNADGSGKKQLTSGKSNDGQPVWSRDGTRIFYRSDQDGTEWAIYVMNADGSGKRKLIGGTAPDPDLWGWESLSLAP